MQYNCLQRHRLRPADNGAGQGVQRQNNILRYNILERNVACSRRTPATASTS
ncbi:MAG: hypothetical protein WKG07_00660 [Hymenobacter sp.]